MVEPLGCNLMNFDLAFFCYHLLLGSLFGNPNEIDIVLTTFQKFCKSTYGRLELLTSIVDYNLVFFFII